MFSRPVTTSPIHCIQSNGFNTIAIRQKTDANFRKRGDNDKYKNARWDQMKNIYRDRAELDYGLFGEIDFFVVSNQIIAHLNRVT